jgi:GNAT superfamily N-acetyltransferase
MNETIRTLTVEDIPAALQLSTLAGWNQTAGDWQLLLDLAPNGCFALDVGDMVVASATLLSYGARLGWIGMVLTHPEYRHRGFAKRLFARALEEADTIGIKTLKLDATDQGQPLYESYGFKIEQSMERWFRPAGETKKALAAPAELADWYGLDKIAFGVARARLLELLRLRGQRFANSDACLLTRPGRVSAYLGPCVAKSRDAARNVMTQAISASEAGEFFWDLLPSNQEAVSLASELGFLPQRRLTRMFRGEELRGRDELVYAIAGFELG